MVREDATNVPETAAILAVIPDIDKMIRLGPFATRSLDKTAFGPEGG